MKPMQIGLPEVESIGAEGRDREDLVKVVDLVEEGRKVEDFSRNITVVRCGISLPH